MAKKPELLVPVGSIESFHAALEGGADAVYLGLKKFNARSRAKNLTCKQLQELMGVAKNNNLKIYITLNTVVKNEELAVCRTYRVKPLRIAYSHTGLE